MTRQNDSLVDRSPSKAGTAKTCTIDQCSGTGFNDCEETVSLQEVCYFVSTGADKLHFQTLQGGGPVTTLFGPYEKGKTSYTSTKGSGTSYSVQSGASGDYILNPVDGDPHTGATGGIRVGSGT